MRMSHPVTPGQNLKIEMWNRYYQYWFEFKQKTLKSLSASKNVESGEIIVLFRTKIEETDDICLSGGWIKLKEFNQP